MAENTTSVKPPFSVAELRESQDFLEQVAPEINETVTYGRPDPTQWFRINPDIHLEAAIFEHAVGDKKTDHLVLGEAIKFAPIKLKLVALYQWVCFDTGELALWAVPRINPDHENDYTATKLRAVEEAKTQWLRIETDLARSRYKILIPKKKNQAKFLAKEPDWKTGLITFDAMVQIHFKDKFIRDVDHPFFDALDAEEI